MGSLSRSSASSGTPMRAANWRSMTRHGKVFKYSMTCGSMPELRIRPSVLRDVPQRGLW
jgi:hypothetical protein